MTTRLTNSSFVIAFTSASALAQDRMSKPIVKGHTKQ